MTTKIVVVTAHLKYPNGIGGHVGFYIDEEGIAHDSFPELCSFTSMFCPKEND